MPYDPKTDDEESVAETMLERWVERRERRARAALEKPPPPYSFWRRAWEIAFGVALAPVAGAIIWGAFILLGAAIGLTLPEIPAPGEGPVVPFFD